MTPEKQRLALAEACGWSVSAAGRWSHPTLPDNGGAEPYPPDYINDRNAMYEVVNTLGLVDRMRFIEQLDTVTARTSNEWFPARIVLSKKNQWAEAFLRAIGKWEDL
jgi:hypothetical protein